MYVGDFVAGSTVYAVFTTNAQTGARVAFSGALETDDIRVYKNGSATERASQAGYTVTSAFDSLVGVHLVAIDTSDNTDAGFFAAGSDYHIVLYPDTETVDSLAVAGRIAQFSIENRANLTNLTAFGTGAIKVLGIVDRGVAQAGSATTIQLRSAATFANSEPNGAVVVLVGGTGAGQSRFITGYVGSTDTATVDTWTTNPDSTTQYIVIGAAPASATALPTVLISQGTGTGQLDFTSGVVKANPVQWNGTAVATPDTAGYPKVTIKSGTGTGEISLSSGIAAASLSAAERNSAADAILDRNMATGTDSGSPTVRTVRQALRALRNDVNVVGTTLTVTKEDDTTASWTAVVTGTPAVTEINPA